MSEDAILPKSAPQRVDLGAVSVFLGDNGGKFPDGNQVIVTGRDAKIAFDTPLVSRRLGPEFDGLDGVVLSHVHEDHMVGLRRLAHVPVQVPKADLPAIRSWEGFVDACGIGPNDAGATLASFERDFDYAPRADAIGYDDGAVWDLGDRTIRAVHLPGHTAGHSALLIEPDGIAFIGDIDLSGFGPYYGDHSSTLAGFRQTLRKLRELPAKIWITYHHRGIYTDREKFHADLSLFEAKFDERNRRLVDLLRQSSKSLPELVASRLLYPDHYNAPFVDGVEERTIARHLAELVASGVVEENGGSFHLRD